MHRNFFRFTSARRSRCIICVRKLLTNLNRVGSRFATVRFTMIDIYGPFESDRSLPTCGASLSQLQRPFCPFCTSRSFLVFTCFLFFYLSAILLSWLWFFHPWRPSKRPKRRKSQNSCRYILSWRLLNHDLGLLQKNKTWFDWYFL